MRPIRYPQRGWNRILIFLCCLLAAGSVRAGGATRLGKARASYQKKRAAIEKKYLEELPASVGKKYIKLLSEYVETYRGEGKLEEFLTAKEERERFQTTETVEESDVVEEPEYVRNAQQQFIRITQANQRKMLKQQAQLATSYLHHLEGLQKKLMQKYLTNQALLVKKEIETVQATVDFSVLTPPKKPRKTKTAARSKRPKIAPLRERVAPDQLAVYLQSSQGPVRDLKVELKPQNAEKAQSRRTDRKGRAEFITKPDLEYTIQVINSKYEPFIRAHGISGESYSADLIPLPEGVKLLKSSRFAEFKLPGISSIRLYGTYSATGLPVLAVRMKPSSLKTEFPECLPDPHGVRVNVDTWVPVTEGLSRVDMKVLVPTVTSRIILYRKVPRNAPVTGSAQVAQLSSEEKLVVHATAEQVPIPKLQIECQPYADGNVMIKATDPKGETLFRVDPEAEYVIRILSPAYLPFTLPNCTGGETYPAALTPMPDDLKLIRISPGGNFKLPGISALQIAGSSGTVNHITHIHMRTTSSTTTFSEGRLGPKNVRLPVDTWVTLSERSRSVEIKILAPDAETRMILYRKLS